MSNKILSSLKSSDNVPYVYLVQVYENGAQEWQHVKPNFVVIVYNTGDVIRLDKDHKVIEIETHDGIYLKM